MATDKELSDFLASVEKRAYQRALYAVRDSAAALDIVQEAMIRLAEHYADRPVAELLPLFQRIVSHAIIDWSRRKKVRDAHEQTFSSLGTDEDSPIDLLETLQLDPHTEPLQSRSAADWVEGWQTLQAIENALAALPARQREAFLLRYWEELDVAQTAQAMGCSVGSVKTHCFRAVQALATLLKNKGISL